MPLWANYAVWWHVYPLGFVGAEREAAPVVAHRLRHLHAWLDYAVELGATGLALGPIFASQTHGYDTTDYFRIDPRLGDEADFGALAEEAHRRGLRIALDGVFNHVGRGFPAFAEVLAQGPGAAKESWFRLSWSAGAGAGSEPDYACFEGHRELVSLNHDNPEVAAYVAEVMSYWLDRGADGWRLDAAYAVPPRFWAEVLPRVRAGHPESFIFGEVIHGDYGRFVREGGLDSVTQYELWKAIWSALNDRNLFELAWALERHNGFLDAFVPVSFLGNHDVTRLASRLSDLRHLPHALAILIACGGTPMIYAGDEQGFRGVKENRAGGDDAVRPVFPASPAGLAPDGWETYRLHQQLIGLRRRHPWLSRARTEKLHLTNQQMVLGSQQDGSSLLLALNLGDGASALPVPRARHIEAGHGALSGAGDGQAAIELPPHGWAVLAT